MAIDDRKRWNEKYRSMEAPSNPIKLVEEFFEISRGKEALDIACGMGRHAKFLASHGYKVDALDISSVAISSLRDIKNVYPREVDFDTYTVEKEKYDLIVCTYFLDRSLFPKIYTALKEGGILLYETFVYHLENEKAPKNKSFLLQKGELESQFSDQYEILHLKEDWGKDAQGFKAMIGSMAAKKKAVTGDNDAFGEH